MCSGFPPKYKLQYLAPGPKIRIYLIAEDEIGIVERLGEFSRLAYPGVLILFAPLCYPVEALRKRMDSRVNQLNIQTDVKSKDNVFVKLGISVMFHLVKEQAYDACYTMDDRDGQTEGLHIHSHTLSRHTHP